jgi:CubicO group peptidase (beta-lactamase class C family)
LVPLLRSSAPDVLVSTLSTLARRHGVPGAQLAVREGPDTTAVDHGVLEHGRAERVTAAAAVPVGSITKSATATLAMVLVADGDLELDGPIGEHLPELPGDGAAVTLRQLLSHTAGWASGPDSDDVATASVRRYVAEHCGRRNVVAPPGTAFSYSNLGYVLVGHLLETVTGMGWREAVGSIVLRPLGIEPTFVPDGAAGGRPVAVGHSVSRVGGRVRPVAQSLAPVEAPAGALALSAADLVALASPHLGRGRPELLPPQDAARMRAPVRAAVPYGLADAWGLGLGLFQSGATTWAGHDGNAHGTSCYLRFDADGERAIALTTNSNTGAELWPELLEALAAEGFPVPAPPSAGSTGPAVAPPAGATGTYRNGDVEYVVADRAGRLQLSVDGDDFTPLSCARDLTFALRDPETGAEVVGGRFVRDPRTQQVGAIQLGGRLAVRDADRYAPRRIA